MKYLAIAKALLLNSWEEGMVFVISVGVTAGSMFRSQHLEVSSFVNLIESKFLSIFGGLSSVDIDTFA